MIVTPLDISVILVRGLMPLGHARFFTFITKLPPPKKKKHLFFFTLLYMCTHLDYSHRPCNLNKRPARQDLFTPIPDFLSQLNLFTSFQSVQKIVHKCFIYICVTIQFHAHLVYLNLYMHIACKSEKVLNTTSCGEFFWKSVIWIVTSRDSNNIRRRF